MSKCSDQVVWVGDVSWCTFTTPVHWTTCNGEGQVTKTRHRLTHLHSTCVLCRNNWCNNKTGQAHPSCFFLKAPQVMAEAYLPSHLFNSFSELVGVRVAHSLKKNNNNNNNIYYHNSNKACAFSAFPSTTTHLHCWMLSRKRTKRVTLTTQIRETYCVHCYTHVSVAFGLVVYCLVAKMSSGAVPFFHLPCTPFTGNELLVHKWKIYYANSNSNCSNCRMHRAK